MTDYEVLKVYGHTPAKAAEIALDASRGDDLCQKWIERVRKYIATISTGSGACPTSGPVAGLSTGDTK